MREKIGWEDSEYTEDAVGEVGKRANKKGARMTCEQMKWKGRKI